MTADETTCGGARSKSRTVREMAQEAANSGTRARGSRCIDRGANVGRPRRVAHFGAHAQRLSLPRGGAFREDGSCSCLERYPVRTTGKWGDQDENAVAVRPSANVERRRSGISACPFGPGTELAAVRRGADGGMTMKSLVTGALFLGMVLAACLGGNGDGTSSAGARAGAAGDGSAGTTVGGASGHTITGGTGSTAGTIATAGISGGAPATGGAGGGVGGSAAGSGSGGTSAGGSSGSTGGGGSDECSPEVPAGAAPVVCGSDTCAPDEICVRPCCGGPAPACEPLPASGTCTPPDLPHMCEDGMPGCLDVCTAPPPFCVPASDISCRCKNWPRYCEPPSMNGCDGELDQDVRNVMCQCA